MRIADISVSRVHSFIRICGNELIIQDNGSKFGTLVKISKPIALLQARERQNIWEDSSLAKPKNQDSCNSCIYQVGRTMLYFRLCEEKVSYKRVKQYQRVNSLTELEM